MKLLKLYKKAGIIVFLLLELILFSAITPNFLSGSNFINLLRQIAMLGDRLHRHFLSDDRRSFR